MPLCAVLDSTVLVSAFLTPRGAADAVLQYAINNRFLCCLAEGSCTSILRISGW
jgi:hypothetical protein